MRNYSEKIFIFPKSFLLPLCRQFPLPRKWPTPTVCDLLLMLFLLLSSMTITQFIYLFTWYICMSSLSPILYCLDYHSITVKFEIRVQKSSNFVLIKVISASQVLCISIQILKYLSISTKKKNAAGILIGIRLFL